MSKKIPFTSKAKVHFMGIGGSGMGSVALLAQSAGFEVEGSDIQSDTPYLSKIKKAGIKTYVGHDNSHLEGVDILAVSPAVFFNSQDGFLSTAKEEKIPIMTWQEFMGRFLHKDKTVICVAGAHGKSTSTALLGLCLEKAGFDPTVEVGATVTEWKSNVRVGASDIFITEADEFYDNFLHYYPETILLTNIEYEHPDYFKNEADYFESFRKFTAQLRGNKKLIVNLDDKGVERLVTSLSDNVRESISIVGFTVNDRALFETSTCYKAYYNLSDKSFSQFTFEYSLGDRQNITLPASGEHNIYNTLGVLTTCAEIGASVADVSTVVSLFKGIGRRLEVIGKESGVTIIDDYAHHPTEIKASLQAVHSRFPKSKILAIIEPHSYSRTKAVLHKYKGIGKLADTVLIAPIFIARDSKNFGINEESVCRVMGNTCIAFEDPKPLIKWVTEHKSDYDIVIVMGAGKSHLIARNILKSL